MRFVDEAVIQVKAGNGGNGCVSFRREKFIPKGGPDGGNGGSGGDVVIIADKRLLSLYDFRVQRRYEAQNGRGGQGSQRHGKKGMDSVIRAPIGTLVFERVGSEERFLFDVSEPEVSFLVAQGGRGGKGNEHFKSSTMRTPRFAQKGEPGEEKVLRLELKLLADAGIVGLPNAGKSTLISKLSAARPKIDAYPFTTITPNLGVMIDEYDPGKRIIIADIPGLIEGAHKGHGLGIQFLKHIERTRFFIHVLSVEDVCKEGNPWAGFELVNDELEAFDNELIKRRQILVVNKTDLCSAEELEELKRKALSSGKQIRFISARQGVGLEELASAMWELKETVDRHEPLIRFKNFEQPQEESIDVEVVYTQK